MVKLSPAIVILWGAAAFSSASAQSAGHFRRPEIAVYRVSAVCPKGEVVVEMQNDRATGPKITLIKGANIAPGHETAVTNILSPLHVSSAPLVRCGQDSAELAFVGFSKATGDLAYRRVVITGAQIMDMNELPKAVKPQ
ncbi:hypothetical protein [Caulobacter sp. NIBR2454]|uniref:hypothetical protein n=1 Tax=Caulobacter sp. NIBR2454 TaxID=3015996 RepID=UPI0022B6D9F0|nr:hypothetical protein [Caulobacter sp. NIBR2454]